MNWQLKTFEALSTYQLYEILRLRSEVFVVEQRCVYGDLDGLDRHDQSYHLMALSDASEHDAAQPPITAPTSPLIAYARLLPPGLAYADACSIRRVVVSAEHRVAGRGHALMKEAIARAQQLWPAHDIKIGAQAYLERFYMQHGFKVIGPQYDEDGIPHLPMALKRI